MWVANHSIRLLSERMACIEGQCRDQVDRYLHSILISWDTDEDTRMRNGYPETTLEYKKDTMACDIEEKNRAAANPETPESPSSRRVYGNIHERREAT